MDAQKAQKTLLQDLQEMRDDLRRMADELRVRLHLAGMDAKDAWHDLQPQLEDFERRMDTAAEQVGDELKALGADIRQRMLNIKNKLRTE